MSQMMNTDDDQGCGSQFTSVGEGSLGENTEPHLEQES